MCLILKYPFWSMLLRKTEINKKQSGRLYPSPTKNIPATPTLCFSVPYSSSPIQGIIVSICQNSCPSCWDTSGTTCLSHVHDSYA